MSRQLLTIWLCILLCLDACVERYEAPVVEAEPAFVMDAELTDQPGAHVVKLFLTSVLNQNLESPVLVSGATVSISDDAGATEWLSEVSEGVYHTRENYSGRVGHRYKLVASLESGEQLESDFVEMKPAGEISRLYYEYQFNAINPQDPSLPQNAVNLYLDATGAEGQVSLLRWRWRGTYQVHTRPELRTKRDSTGNVVPDPIPCSGYIVDNRNRLLSIFPCECCDCWPTEYSGHAYVSSSHTVTNTFNRVYIGQIPVDQWHFFVKYHLQVEQLSLTDESHNFWKLVQAQQQGGTNIFQPNVVNARGNVRTVSGQRKTYGVFSVSSVASATLEIKRAELPVPPFEPDVIIRDCRHYIENSSNIQPAFW